MIVTIDTKIRFHGSLLCQL